MATITAIYNCAQNVLYSALELIWETFTTDVDTFHNYKAAYTAASATDADAAIATAAGMPEAAVNVAIAEEIGVDVKKLAAIVILDFNKTKGYINTAFAKEYQHANYTQAGQAHYTKATNHDWESVKSLGLANHAYISNLIKKPLLEANNNMPTAFIGIVDTNNTNFGNKYTAYTTAMNTADSTDDKLTANNNCFTTGRNMLNDAAILFPDNPNYVWDHVVESIDPQEQGIKGTAKNAITSLPLAITITAKMEGSQAVTVTADAKGKFKQSLPHGIYTITISLRGYITQTITKEITLHNMSRLNPLMQPE